MKVILWSVVVVICAMLPLSRTQASTINTLEAMNMASLLESASMTLRILDESYGFAGSSPLVFTGTYSQSGGTLRISGTTAGSPLVLDLTSTLTGNFSGNVTVGLSATGSWLGVPINTTGQSIFLYNSVLDGYDRMDYDDQGSIGTGSRAWVVRGAEVAAGAVVGGFIGGLWGAGQGVRSAITVSNIIYEIIDGLTPPLGPVRPPFPQQPILLTPLPPNTVYLDGENETINVVFGNVSGSGSFGGGVMSGLFAPVPEPSTYAMALAGLACGGYSMWRRRRRA